VNIIRLMDRFYAKHPNISFAIAILCVFLIMCIARDWDNADTAALRLQMMSSNGRAT
jgi:hypothetical protein